MACFLTILTNGVYLVEKIKYEHHYEKMYLGYYCPFKVKFLKNSINSTSNWHKNPEFIYVSKGNGTLNNDGKSYAIKQGDLFIINPETVHHIFSEKGIDYYFIIVDEDFFKENGIVLDRYTFDIEISDSITKEKFLKIINETELYTENYTDISPAKVRNAVLELLVDVCEKHSSKRVEDREKVAVDYVKKALEYINDNFKNDITLEEIAEYVGINKFYLTREFKKFTNQTVFFCINSLRCKNAESLLQSGSSITEAAVMSGFESVSYFSRTYKKLRGYSPSMYKENNKDSIAENKKLYIESNWNESWSYFRIHF